MNRKALRPGTRPASDAAQSGARKGGADNRDLAKITPAREAAFEILLRVDEGSAHSDDLLHAARVTALSPEDRNLATALVMGVLRRQITLDAQIAKLLARPEQQLAEPVAIALRMGALQLLHMDRIPAHAAINESVELCRAANHAHAAGMVNAILREMARQMQAAKQREPQAVKRGTPIFESTAAFAERLGHPLWLVERWVANYGRAAALSISEYGQHEPGAGPLFTEAVLVATPTAASLPSALLQIDDGSRLVAELAAAAVAPLHGRTARIWDCCAAPGGKTLVMAERLPKAQILATDISVKRMARMVKRISSTPHAARIRCEVMDAQPAPARSADAEASGGFDLVLCDMPCSGTGTLARNPEIRHRLRPEDLTRQAARQQAILRGAIERLAPGGRLLYSTCSLEPEESEQVIDAVLRECGATISRLPIEPLLTRIAETNVLPAETVVMLAHAAVRNGCLRTLPGVHPCDGFFAALLERI